MQKEKVASWLAPSLGKFTRALEVTLKIGNDHLLFQARVRDRSKSKPRQSECISRPDSHGKTRFEGLAPAHLFAPGGFPYRAESHLPDLKPVPYSKQLPLEGQTYTRIWSQNMKLWNGTGYFYTRLKLVQSFYLDAFSPIIVTFLTNYQWKWFN